MEVIIFIITFAIVVSNFKKRAENSDKSTSSVWDAVESNVKLDDITRGVRDFEDVINKLKNSSNRATKQKKESLYQKEQQVRRKKEEDARRVRDNEERQKKKLELKKKQEEQRKRQLEKERKAKEEKELLARFAGTTSYSPVEPATTSEPAAKVTVNEAAGKDKVLKKASVMKEDHNLFRTEEYLDPLTSSFYPDVDDYLFPTIAPFYPKVDISSFSLQNEADVI